jgi:hypothetical protein
MSFHDALGDAEAEAGSAAIALPRVPVPIEDVWPVLDGYARALVTDGDLQVARHARRCKRDRSAMRAELHGAADDVREDAQDAIALIAT